MTLIFGVCVCVVQSKLATTFSRRVAELQFRMLINILHAANHLVSWEDQGYCIVEAGKTKRCYREREMLLQDTPGILPLYPKRSAVSKDINLWNEEDWWKDCLCLHACLRACLVECLACISWVAMCELVKVLWITQRMVVRCEWLYACQRIEDAERGDLYSPQGSRMFEGKKQSTADTNSGKTLEHQWSTSGAPWAPVLRAKRPKTSKTPKDVPKRPKEASAVDPPRLSKHSPNISRSRGNSRFSEVLCRFRAYMSYTKLGISPVPCLHENTVFWKSCDFKFGEWLRELVVEWSWGELRCRRVRECVLDWVTGSLLECHCIQPRKLKVSLWDLFYCILYIKLVPEGNAWK